MLFGLISDPKQWSQQTMDYILWNYKPKYNLFSFKLYLLSILVTAVKIGHWKNHMAYGEMQLEYNAQELSEHF